MSPDGVMDRLQIIPFVGLKRLPVRGGVDVFLMIFRAVAWWNDAWHLWVTISVLE